MGNRIGKIGRCFAGDGDISRRYDPADIIVDPHDGGFGHSFYYLPPDPHTISSSKDFSDEYISPATTIFRSISGASVSANVSTPLSTSLVDLYPYSTTFDRAAAFDCSNSFASVPLQPVPRHSVSGNSGGFPYSGPIERGFLSGPLASRNESGPIDRGVCSGPIEKSGVGPEKLRRSFSHSGVGDRQPKSKRRSLIRILKKAISKTISRNQKAVSSRVRESESYKHNENAAATQTQSSVHLSSHASLAPEDDGDYFLGGQSVQWAQGKAGEDRVHVVISEDNGWVFVGIYDGFNGPDAPDYLLANLYAAVLKELKGLIWNDKFDSTATSSSMNSSNSASIEEEDGTTHLKNHQSTENFPAGNKMVNLEAESMRKRERVYNTNYRTSQLMKRADQNPKTWKCEWERERLEFDGKMNNKQLDHHHQIWDESTAINHSEVLNALSQALRKTEEAYLQNADKMVTRNPELALMGSCVLVMLMRGEDVYLMNVGDSRAIVAQQLEPDFGIGKQYRDLERINEGTLRVFESSNGVEFERLTTLASHQLTMDHSTYTEEEVQRIKKAHPNDASAIMNDRVKGYLKITRAFGAGFLKQPKWNDALLEMFRIDYVGNSPYITCDPTLCHYKLSPTDRFLILSSDGLYQYFTNEEAVSQVESFIAAFPEGDPAQHLIEEVLFRAAKKYGMDFHELLDIPQGERRKYHDDVSVIIISFEGRIWHSLM
ncbi:probable protein phosphatase 2C 23 [Cucurbita pepo subsp. pepo]|uniref:probable protein phosphatase 2C 23 n=1 Tax=Cucurbita pepo subsp. pepo TaxID=3664 RepID=UPI000C9D52CB|nr:probable protein phosphatase 2C 23 [Cucurbita pepo subsp. pepo]